MLTKADDFPVHQTPEPIAFAGQDRNFYDRYFFNGTSADGAVFFAAAMGFYPQLGIADAAFSLVIDGIQHNIRASRHIAAGERLDLEVGAIRITVILPLQQLRIVVTGNDSGITADLVFNARHPAIEEPRFTRRNGTRLFMDYTRMTQNGGWTGTITAPSGAIALDPATTLGTRDRSWGVRPVGAPESQPPPQGNLGQFFWLWSPCNFPAHAVFAHTNDDAHGLPWNRRAVVNSCGDAPNGAAIDIDDVDFQFSYRAGTRRLVNARITLGRRGALLITPTGRNFYMQGLGYTHPVWGHGLDHGKLAVAHDRIDLEAIDDNAPGNLHVQALSTALLQWDGAEYHGRGVLEQLLIGPHAPSGFAGLLDGAA